MRKSARLALQKDNYLTVRDMSGSSSMLINIIATDYRIERVLLRLYLDSPETFRRGVVRSMAAQLDTSMSSWVGMNRPCLWFGQRRQKQVASCHTRESGTKTPYRFGYRSVSIVRRCRCLWKKRPDASKHVRSKYAQVVLCKLVESRVSFQLFIQARLVLARNLEGHFVCHLKLTIS